MWVTTNNGIYVINYYDSSVQQRYVSNSKEYANMDFQAGIISRDNANNIYLPYNAGGLYQYNSLKNTTRYFPVTDTTIKGFSYAFSPSDKDLLIGSSGALKQADTSSGKLTLKPHIPAGFKDLATYPGRVVWAYQKSTEAIYFKKASGKI